MTLVCEDVAKDVPLVHAGALSSADVSDDIGRRGQVAQGGSEAVLQKFGGGVPDDPEETHAVPPQEPSAVQSGSRRPQYPRVDAPEVERAASMAIREDRPGYIAVAFPKLFPHGIGDSHDNQGGRVAPNSPHRLLSFPQWGRFLMTWHDNRFSQHTRFRYWLLDTSLRAMSPSIQHMFLKTHASSKNYILEDLQDSRKRKDLV